jgi:aryl-alcohol dehydrogenase-like predicted oxidoreductase
MSTISEPIATGNPTLNYKVFGRRTGLRVSELALGVGMFGTRWGHGATPAEARQLFDGYAEAGGNFLDTADGYQLGESEEILGDFLAADRDHFVLATKYSFGAESGKGGVTRSGNSRQNMVRSVEASLKRLKTDRIDLYWAHMADGVTPLEEIMRAFDDLVRAGKILYAGLSDFPAWRMAHAATLADLRGWAPLAGVQFEYSLMERTPDRELLPMAEAYGLGTALWSPLAGGFLTGKYRNGAKEGRLTSMGGNLVHQEKSTRETAILDAVLATADELGVPASHVAIAWLRAQAAQSAATLIPIIGPRTRAQLDDNLAALRVTLSPEQVARLTTASAVVLGFPHDLIAATQGLLTGGQTDRIDQPRFPVV